LKPHKTEPKAQRNVPKNQFREKVHYEVEDDRLLFLLLSSECVGDFVCLLLNTFMDFTRPDHQVLRFPLFLICFFFVTTYPTTVILGDFFFVYERETQTKVKSNKSIRLINFALHDTTRKST
jgi:hypothetical protein